jgi:hypothetical protein
MTGGAHLLARHGEAGAPSCDGGRNREGHWRGTRAYWARQGRRQPWKEWAGVAGWANSIGKKKKIKRVLIFKFKLISEFGKTLRISTRRFRRNLDIWIFLKFF